MNLYACLVSWSEGELSHIRIFWTRGQTVGEAIHAALAAAEASVVSGPSVEEVELVDLEDLPPTVLTENGGITFADRSIHSFPTEDTYRLPYGVVHSFQDGDYEKDTITEGYELSEEDRVFELEVVADEADLLNLYLELVSTLPEVDAFWLQLQEDWEDGAEAFYVTEALTSRQEIAAFFDRHHRDTVQNGHVTCTAYADIGRSNLSLTDHKTLRVSSRSGAIIAEMRDVLERTGLREKTPLISVTWGFHHLHYRHPEGLGREALVLMLEGHGFERWHPETDT